MRDREHDRAWRTLAHPQAIPPQNKDLVDLVVLFRSDVELLLDLAENLASDLTLLDGLSPLTS
jgi:hypothetical protein